MPKATVSDSGSTRVPSAPHQTNGSPPHSSVGETPGAVANSLAAFARERADLFRTDPFRWVAYQDGKRLRLADTQTELYRHCLQDLGLAHDAFLVRCITPEDPLEIENTLR
jgi:hypothetical protein